MDPVISPPASRMDPSSAVMGVVDPATSSPLARIPSPPIAGDDGRGGASSLPTAVSYSHCRSGSQPKDPEHQGGEGEASLRPNQKDPRILVCRRMLFYWCRHGSMLVWMQFKVLINLGVRTGTVFVTFFMRTRTLVQIVLKIRSCNVGPLYKSVSISLLVV